MRLPAETHSADSSRQGSPKPFQPAPTQASPSKEHDKKPYSRHEEPDDNLFRPSKDLRVEDETAAESLASNHALPPTNERRPMPPPVVSASRPDPQEKASSRFSFTIKTKAAPTPKADFSQKMREMAARRDPPGPTERPKRTRSSVDDDVGQDPTHKRRMETPPEKRVVMRLKPRPTLPPELAASDSVYFRKPGNESVVGSGTYGKVFKAIHVYTKDRVALKKIRMEGERDGVWPAHPDPFPLPPSIGAAR